MKMYVIYYSNNKLFLNIIIHNILNIFITFYLD